MTRLKAKMLGSSERKYGGDDFFVAGYCGRDEGLILWIEGFSPGEKE